MTRLTKTFEKNETYIVKFMPNLHNPQNSVVELMYSTKNKPMLSRIYFSYCVRNNEATPVTYGMSIYNALKQCMRGYIGTTDGYFITDDSTQDRDNYPNVFDKYGKLLYYFANEDKTHITLNKEYARENNLSKFTDHINLAEETYKTRKLEKLDEFINKNNKQYEK